VVALPGRALEHGDDVASLELGIVGENVLMSLMPNSRQLLQREIAIGGAPPRLEPHTGELDGPASKLREV